MLLKLTLGGSESDDFDSNKQVTNSIIALSNVDCNGLLKIGEESKISLEIGCGNCTCDESVMNPDSLNDTDNPEILDDPDIQDDQNIRDDPNIPDDPDILDDPDNLDDPENDQVFFSSHDLFSEGTLPLSFSCCI
jgi:hypothetical protein